MFECVTTFLELLYNEIMDWNKQMNSIEGDAQYVFLIVFFNNKCRIIEENEAVSAASAAAPSS